MADLVYSLIKDHLNLLPLRGVQFQDPLTEEYSLFLQLEQESSYNINPYTKANSLGGLNTLAYKIDFSMYVIQNPFNQYNGDMLKRLEDYRNKQIHVWFLLGAIEPDSIDENSPWKNFPAAQAPFFTYPLQDTLRNKVFNFTNKMLVDFGLMYVNYKIESVPLRPRLIITGTGIVQSTINILLPDVESSDPDKLLMFQ